MSTKKDLLLLLLDVGEHMQPYLPLLHRMAFNVLNCKLLSKPNHEVAIVLYGTKGTRHKLYEPDLAYPHVTVLRPLQNVASYLALRRFAFLADPAAAPPDEGPPDDDSGAPAGEPATTEAAAAALVAHMEAGGLAYGDAATAAARARALFGSPGPRADWADGLVVALDLLASALQERFDKGQPEAGRQGAVRLMVVSNFLSESEPFDEEFRSQLVATCNERAIALEVVCVDHYVPPPPPAAAAAAGDAAASTWAAGGPGPYSLSAVLPPDLAASRTRNLDQLHLLKAELAPAPFRHLRQPAELLCVFKSKEVALQATNAIFELSPGATAEEDAAGASGALTLKVKLYKKIRAARVEEWKMVMKPSVGAAAPGGGGPSGSTGADGGGGGGADEEGGLGFIRDVEYEDPTTGQKFARTDTIVRGYAYGKQLVPVEQYALGLSDASAEEQAAGEKDLSLLGFVSVGTVQRHQLMDEPYVMLGDGPSAAAAIAALALTLEESARTGVVRFILRARTDPRLGLLTPHLSRSTDVPHCLLLSPLPFAEDIRTHTFSTLRNKQEAADLPQQLAEARRAAGDMSGQPQRGAVEENGGGEEGASQLSALLRLGGSQAGAGEGPASRFERLQPDDEQQAAALALVCGLDLGPSGPLPGRAPHPEALAPEAIPNPHLQRQYTIVTSMALDPQAQLPDANDDPLVELVLRPHGRYWPPGSQQPLRAAEDKLRTRERVNGPAAKRSRREEGGASVTGTGDAAAAAVDGEGAGTAAAAADQHQLLFDPSAVGGTSARVSRVSELSAVEDYRAMLGQGRDSASDAIRQMESVVRSLVERSIGDQLYDKAVQCLQALRAGCTATGRAAAFNTFLQELVDWCKREGLGPFVSLLVSQGISLITSEELARHQPAAATADGSSGLVFEDDGGGVEPHAARLFLERHTRTEAVAEEGTLPTVLADEEFEDMD